jgi:hypothetical protein
MKTRKYEPILGRIMIKITMMITELIFESPLDPYNTSCEILRIMVVITVTFICRVIVSMDSVHSSFGDF